MIGRSALEDPLSVSSFSAYAAIGRLLRVQCQISPDDLRLGFPGGFPGGCPGGFPGGFPYTTVRVISRNLNSSAWAIVAGMASLINWQHSFGEIRRHEPRDLITVLVRGVECP